MRTFAQKPKAPQQATPAKPTIPARSHFGQSQEVNSILHLQRTSGNQAVQRLLQAHAEELNAALTGPASPHFGHDVSRIPVSPPPGGAIQTKLAIDQPDDKCEHEADRAADQITGTPASELTRRQSEGETWQPDSLIQGVTSTRATDGPLIVRDALGSPGQPLDAAARDFMESRFGHDFSRVRVHTDQTAAESAQAIRARAYALGDDLVFGAGQYVPASDGGRRLLAHELAHVIGQRLSPGPGVIQRAKADQKPIEPLDDPDVQAAIDTAWRESFGHEPFSSALDPNDLPQPNEPEPGSEPSTPNKLSSNLPLFYSYQEGKYEGVTFREAYFFIDADGKPSPILVSKYPLNVPHEDMTNRPSSALAGVHTHPTQKRARSTETGGTLEIIGVASSEDQIAAKGMQIPVYSVAEKTILKTYPDGRTEVFSRRKLSRSK